MKWCITLTLLSIGFFSCQLTSPVEAEKPIIKLNSRLHDIWALKEIDGKDVEQQQRAAYLEFNLTTNKVYGNTGCNSLSGDLMAEGDSLLLSNLAVTEMFCAGYDNEQEYLNQIQEPMKYELNGLELKLLSDKNELTFRKVD